MHLIDIAFGNAYLMEHLLPKVFLSDAYRTQVLPEVHATKNDEKTDVDFGREGELQHLLRLPNDGIRTLCQHDVQDFVIALKLACASQRSKLCDRYIFRIKNIKHDDLLMFRISQYLSSNGTPVDPFYACNDLPLSRVVELSVNPVIPLPQFATHL